jgi:protein angel
MDCQGDNSQLPSFPAMLASNQVLSWRRWDLTRLGRELQTNDHPPGNSMEVTLMSYNILAQQYLNDCYYLYDNCPSGALSWDYRSKCLLQEIKHHLPDVLCMQEVDEEHYFEFLFPELMRAGYAAVFKRKTGIKRDGSAVFYKTDLFELISYSAPEFYMPGVPCLDREMVGIIAHLTPKGKGLDDSFFVATTHLLYNPHRSDIRLAQLQVFFAELDRVAFCGVDPSIGDLPRYKPIILCGDFNFNPWTPVYKFVTEGRFRFAGRHAASLGDTTTGRTLNNDLIPPYVGITDSCQHASVAAERLKWAGCSDSILERYAHDNRSYMAAKNIVLPSAESDTDERRNPPPKSVDDDFWIRGGGGMRAGANDDSREALTPPEGSNGEEQEEPGEVGHRLRFPFGSGTLTHNFDFRSVYKHRFFQLPNRPYEVTTFQVKWVTVDYIFYTTPFNPRVGKREENRLQLLGRYRLLNPDQSSQIGAMPTYGVPSDHYPLMAKFLLHLKPTEDRQRRAR